MTSCLFCISFLLTSDHDCDSYHDADGVFPFPNEKTDNCAAQKQQYQGLLDLIHQLRPWAVLLLDSELIVSLQLASLTSCGVFDRRRPWQPGPNSWYFGGR